jgi:hypothetical protein
MCEHLTVTRGDLDGQPIWTCTECADQFVQAPTLQGFSVFGPDGHPTAEARTFENLLVSPDGQALAGWREGEFYQWGTAEQGALVAVAAFREQR